MPHDARATCELYLNKEPHAAKFIMYHFSRIVKIVKGAGGSSTAEALFTSSTEAPFRRSLASPRGEGMMSVRRSCDDANFSMTGLYLLGFKSSYVARHPVSELGVGR